MDQGISRGQLIHSLEANGPALHTSTDQTALVAGKSIGGYLLRDGIVVRATVHMDLARTSTPNFTIVGRLGGVDICTTGAIAIAADGSVIVVFEFTVRSIGATGTIMAGMKAASSIAAMNVGVDVNTAVNVVDYTAAQILDFTGQWSASSASNIAVVKQFFVEVLGSK